jgi:hypothetical protein
MEWTNDERPMSALGDAIIPMLKNTKHALTPNKKNIFLALVCANSYNALYHYMYVNPILANF